MDNPATRFAACAEEARRIARDPDLSGVDVGFPPISRLLSSLKRGRILAYIEWAQRRGSLREALCTQCRSRVWRNTWR